MSFCCCLVNKNGYVMASDSRSSIVESGGMRAFSDNFQKVVYLPNAKLGVIAAGQNTFNGVSFDALVREIEPRLISCSVKVAGDIISQKMRTYGLAGKVNLCIARAGQGDDPESWFWNISANKEQAGPMQNEGIWRNTPDNFDVFSMLYVDVQKNGQYAVQIRADEMPLSEMVEFARHLVETYANVYRFRANLLPVVGGPVQLLCVDRLGCVRKCTGEPEK